jgi:hypothetical protein
LAEGGADLGADEIGRLAECSDAKAAADDSDCGPERSSGCDLEGCVLEGCVLETCLLFLGRRVCRGDDGACTFCEPLESVFGASPAKALLHMISEIDASRPNIRRMMDCP